MDTAVSSEFESTAQRIRAFRQRFGAGHFYLACHAALPLALTPDLLYRIWANFQRDCNDQNLHIPWIAVSDLLLSGLCEEVGANLFEMDKPIRDELLNQLRNDPRFGTSRLREVANFVLVYVDAELHSSDLDRQDFAQAQKWSALAYKNPAETAHEITILLAQLSPENKTEWIRYAELLEIIEEPLSEFRSLVVYARAVAHFVRGNWEVAVSQFRQVVDSNYQLQIAGIVLPLPNEIKTKLQSKFLQSGAADNTLNTKERKHPVQQKKEQFSQKILQYQMHNGRESQSLEGGCFYAVDVQKDDETTLAQVRQFVPSALEDEQGNFIRAGIFSTLSAATRQAELLGHDFVVHVLTNSKNCLN